MVILRPVAVTLVLLLSRFSSNLHCGKRTMCSFHCGNRTMCTVATRTRIIFCATLWSKYSQNSGNLSQEDESSGFKTTFCFHRTKLSIWAAAAYLGQGLLSPDKSQGQHLSPSIMCGVAIWLKHHRPRSSATITQNVKKKLERLFQTVTERFWGEVDFEGKKWEEKWRPFLTWWRESPALTSSSLK